MPGFYIAGPLLNLYNNAKGICHICEEFVPINEASREHVLPKKAWKGIIKGDNIEHNKFLKQNVKLAHKRCNNNKADKFDPADLEVIYAASRTEEVSLAHKQSSGTVSDEEFNKAKEHEIVIINAVKSVDGDSEVLGTVNKNWRCPNCGLRNESEEVTIRHADYLIKIRFCWHCGKEDSKKVEPRK